METTSIDNLVLEPDVDTPIEEDQVVSLIRQIQAHPTYAERTGETVTLHYRGETYQIKKSKQKAKISLEKRLAIELKKSKIECEKKLNPSGAMNLFGLSWSGLSRYGNKHSKITFDQGDPINFIIYSDKFKNNDRTFKIQERFDNKSNNLFTELTIPELIHTIQEDPGYEQIKGETVTIHFQGQTYTIKQASENVRSGLRRLLGQKLRQTSVDVEKRLPSSGNLSAFTLYWNGHRNRKERFTRTTFINGHPCKCEIYSDIYHHSDGRAKIEEKINLINQTSTTELTIPELIHTIQQDPEYKKRKGKSIKIHYQGQHYNIKQGNGTGRTALEKLLGSELKKSKVSFERKLPSTGEFSAFGMTPYSNKRLAAKNIRITYEMDCPVEIGVCSNIFPHSDGRAKIEDEINLINQTSTTELTIPELIHTIQQDPEYKKRKGEAITIHYQGQSYKIKQGNGTGRPTLERLLGQKLKLTTVDVEKHLPSSGNFSAFGLRWIRQSNDSNSPTKVTFDKGKPTRALIYSEKYCHTNGIPKVKQDIDLVGKIETSELTILELLNEIKDHPNYQEFKGGKVKLIYQGQTIYIKHVYNTNLARILCGMLEKASISVERSIPSSGLLSTFGLTCQGLEKFAGNNAKVTFTNGHPTNVELLEDKLQLPQDVPEHDPRQTPVSRNRNVLQELYFHALEKTPNQEDTNKVFFQLLYQGNENGHTLEHNFAKGRALQKVVTYNLLRAGEHVIPETMFQSPRLSFPDLYWPPNDSKPRIGDVKYGGAVHNIKSTIEKYQEIVDLHDFDPLQIYHLVNGFQHIDVEFVNLSEQSSNDDNTRQVLNYIKELDQKPDSTYELEAIDSLYNRLIARNLGIEHSPGEYAELTGEFFDPRTFNTDFKEDDQDINDFLESKITTPYDLPMESHYYDIAEDRFVNKAHLIPTNIQKVIETISTEKENYLTFPERLTLKKTYENLKQWDMPLDDFLDRMLDRKINNPNNFMKYMNQGAKE